MGVDFGSRSDARAEYRFLLVNQAKRDTMIDTGAFPLLFQKTNLFDNVNASILSREIVSLPVLIGI